LPDPEVNTENEYVAPCNEIEGKLVEIWSKVLGVDNIGVTDNFFELGGHSLSALRLMVAIKNEMNIKIPVKIIFQLNTILLISQWVQTSYDDGGGEVWENYEEIKL
jgi:tyrocidine synthetase-3